jgi:hypothetical protein
MKPTIYLSLTHDWELRGDGSGDIEEIQFAPLRRLLKIYEKFGARTTFHAGRLGASHFQEASKSLANLFSGKRDRMAMMAAHCVMMEA